MPEPEDRAAAAAVTRLRRADRSHGPEGHRPRDRRRRPGGEGLASSRGKTEAEVLSRMRAPTEPCCGSRRAARICRRWNSPIRMRLPSAIVLAIGDPFAVGQTVTHGIISALARAGRHHRLPVLHPDRRRHRSPAIPAARWSISTARLSASTPRSSPAAAGRSASASPSPPTSSRRSSPRPGPGSSVVKRPWLGARLQAVTPEIAESIGLKRPGGALVCR